MVVLVGCITVLLVAAWLTPSSRGLGTHEALGLGPCTAVVLFGYPCPTCGMTTAFSHAVRGELVTAFHVQPAGFLLALAVVVAGSVSVSVIVTGRVWVVNWYRLSPSRVALTAVAVFIAGWAYKIIVGVVTGALPVTH